jgi:hypothetical protein
MLSIKPNALRAACAAAFTVLTVVSANAFAVDVTARDGSIVHDRYGAPVTGRYSAPAETALPGDEAAVPGRAAAPAPAQPEATTELGQEEVHARVADKPVYEVNGETIFEFNSTPFDVPAAK